MLNLMLTQVRIGRKFTLDFSELKPDKQTITDPADIYGILQ